MAAIAGARPRKGTLKLIPYYIGMSDGKVDGKKVRLTHYVAISQTVASRLGLKATLILKPGSLPDTQVDGVIFRTLNKKRKNGQKVVNKRSLGKCQGRYKKKIKVYLNKEVPNKKGKQVQESYTIGFPTTVPLSLIRAFFEKNCPNVTRFNTGRNFYQVR